MQGLSAAPPPEVVAIDVDRPGDRPLRLWTHALGLACCAVETAAATARLSSSGDPRGPMGGDPTGGGGTAPRVDVLVVAGTLTDRVAPAVVDLYRELVDGGRPCWVISFGACADSGGPYWDSYAVTKGVDQLIPVDLYVPGCPPRPEALVDALARLGGPDGSG